MHKDITLLYVLYMRSPFLFFKLSVVNYNFIAFIVFINEKTIKFLLIIYE